MCRKELIIINVAGVVSYIKKDRFLMHVTSYRYNNDAVELELDSGEQLILPVLLEYNRYFAKGAEINDKEITVLRSVQERYECTRKAVGYLARGSKSQAQLVQYLKKKKFSSDAVTGAVQYTREHGYLDDAEYASKYIADMTKRKAVGATRIKAALMAKGVSKQIAEQTIAESGFTESIEDALAAARKKIGNKGKTPEKDKLWRFLRYRGFSDDSVRKVMKALEKEGIFSGDDDEGI
jgi:regulatory protein